MSSNPPPLLPPSKSANSTGQIALALSQPASVASGESYGQRRYGGSGSFGAGSTSRTTSSPRNSQVNRKQHKSSKSSRRPRLTDDDAIDESIAMRNTNSRKGQTSITHLMNFSLPPRPNAHRYNPTYSRHSRRGPSWGPGSGYSAVDKARYVHANYRFIVDPRGDYHPQSLDADIHLDWTNVLQILASAQSQDASCPICLGHPVAPRMAKCGHIFCLPCLIRYMQSEDEAKPIPEKKARWKKCPICFDSIYISETRPVRWYVGQEGDAPREGSDVVLRLIMRATGSTLALPRDGADILGKDEDIPWYLAAEVMDYARIMKGSEDYMSEQYDGYIQELEQQTKEDELMFGEDNVEWMRKAIRMIQESKEKVQGIGNPPTNVVKPPEAKPKRPPILFQEAPDMYIQTTTSKSAIATPLSDTITQNVEETGTTPPTHGSSFTAQTRNKPQHESHTPSEYYFYQALLHYYLSPLDIRILKAAFGSFSALPSTILPRVERVSTGHIVDDDLRKRTKYLAHLPYGCEVGFLECDWTDTIPPKILDQFKSDIDRRRKRNQDKEAREEKARLRAEKEEDEKFASARRKRPLLPQDETFSANDFQPLTRAADEGGVPSDADNTGTSPPWANRQGHGYDSLASPSTSPSAPRTVWGTAVIAPSSPVLRAPIDPQMDDGWLQGWEKDSLHEDDVLAQVQAISLGESSSAGAASPVSGPSGGKKKKNKKITLMSTNARRGA